MYVFLSSEDCKGIYTDNHPWDFRVDLHSTLHGQLKCALTEISLGTEEIDELLYVYCDIIKPSNVHENTLPLLRIVQGGIVLQNPYYFDVTRSLVDTIRVYIRTAEGKRPSLQRQTLNCTLHFKHGQPGPG